MKKITLVLCCLFMQNAVSQNLEITPTGKMFISASAHVYLGTSSNLNIATTGAGSSTLKGVLKINSDATSNLSGSLLFNAASTSTGEINYVRDMKTNVWHLISSPVKDLDILKFTTGDNSVLQSNTGAESYAVSFWLGTKPVGFRYQYYAATTNPNIGNNRAHPIGASVGNFVVGKGYSSNEGSSGTPYEFIGNVERGDKTLTIPFETGVTTKATLLGNPYPAFLPIFNLLTDNLTQLEGGNGAIYLSNPNDTKDYPIVNFATILEAQSTPSSATQLQTHIAPGTGFFVITKDATRTNTFKFYAEDQTPQPATINSGFLRSEPLTKITLTLENTSSSVSNTSLYYLSNTTKGLDSGYDAATVIPEGANPNLTIDTRLVEDSQGLDFSIQSLPNTDYELSIVPLAIKASGNQTITISAKAFNLPAGLNVLLEDKAANTVTDITNASHQIQLTEAIVGDGRFYLYTTSNALSIENNTALDIANIYTIDNNTLRISGLQQQNKNATINMYSILGTQVLTNSFTIETENDISLPNGLSPGVYVIQLTSDNNKQTKKIIIE